MTNTELFQNKVKEIGVTYTFIASKLGITGEALYNKINNETEFKAYEIATCSRVLQLSSKERDKNFLM